MASSIKSVTSANSSSSSSSNNAFKAITAVETVQLTAKALHAGLVREVEQRLVHRLQGRCSRHGYVGRVRVQSVHSASVSVLTCALQGSVSVPATVELAVAWPVPGDVLRGRVRGRNAFGLAFTCTFDGVDVVHAIVPRQAACQQLASDAGVGAAAVNRLSPGDCAWIQILGVKPLQDRIHATARIVSGPGVPLPESLWPSPVVKQTADARRRVAQRRHLEDDQTTNTTAGDDDGPNADSKDNEEDDVDGDAEGGVDAAGGSSSDGGCDHPEEDEVFIYDEGEEGDASALGTCCDLFMMAGGAGDNSDDDED
jgi:hypothetical protein